MLPIIIPVRKHSQRCKNKCLRPFYGGMNLTELTCSKYRGNHNVYLTAHEPEFKEIASKYSIGFIQRSLRSASSEIAREILEYFNEFKGQRICLLSGCNPFLKAQTVYEFIEASDGHKSIIMVKKIFDVMFDNDSKVINKDIKCFNSKERQPLYVSSNSGYVFDVDFFFEHGVLWDYADDNPSLYPIDDIEAIDIDTESGFVAAQNMAPEILK